jgi:hypothetical protein
MTKKQTNNEIIDLLNGDKPISKKYSKSFGNQ